jgi:hypothetical protein
VAPASSQEGAPDLLCTKGDLVYAVEIKASAGRARRPLLRALLADAILQARVKASHVGGRALAVLAVPALSSVISAELAAYVKEFGDGEHWGALDDRGHFELHGPGLEEVSVSRATSARGPRRRGSASSAPPYDPFSDLGQWMLKILVAAEVPEKWLRSPRQPLHSVTSLAAAAAVSVPTASRFLAGLRVAGHVIEETGGFRIVRSEALFEAWRAASRSAGTERPARFVLPTSEPARRMHLALVAARGPIDSRKSQPASKAAIAPAGPPGRRACLALFAACRELGVGVVRGAPLHLYCEDSSDPFLARLGLHVAAPGEAADVIVRRPRFPESVFRACVTVDDAPVADIVQCWLDVSFHPARGSEQADELARRIGFRNWDR